MSERNRVNKKSALKKAVGKYVWLSNGWEIEKRGGSARSRALVAMFGKLGLEQDKLYPLVAIIRNAEFGKHTAVLGKQVDGTRQLVEVEWSEHIFEHDEAGEKVPDFDEWLALLPKPIVEDAPIPQTPAQPQPLQARPPIELAVGKILVAPTLEEICRRLPGREPDQIKPYLYPHGKRGRSADLCSRSFPITAVDDDNVTIRATPVKTYDLPIWLCEAFDIAVKTPKPDKKPVRQKSEPVAKPHFLPETAAAIRTMGQLSELIGHLIFVRPLADMHRDCATQTLRGLTKMFGDYEEEIALLVEVDEARQGSECGLIFPAIGVEARLAFQPGAFIALTEARLQKVRDRQLGTALAWLNLSPGEAVRVKTPSASLTIARDGEQLINI